MPLEPFDGAELTKLELYIRRLEGTADPLAVSLQSGFLVLSGPADLERSLGVLARALGHIVMSLLLGRRDRRFAVVPNPESGRWI